MQTSQHTNNPNLIIYGETLIDAFPEQNVIGGAPFNVARSLSLFGARPLMVSRIGKDQNGASILAECARTGLNTEGIQIDAQHASGRVVVELVPSSENSAEHEVANSVETEVKHRFHILPEQAYDYIDTASMNAVLEKYYREVPPDLIYFGSLIQRSAVSQASLIDLLEADITEGASKFLDLNLRDGQANLDTIIRSLNYCDMVKLNEDELQYVIQHACPLAGDQHLAQDAAGLRKACEIVMAEYFMQAMIVTLGARGYFYLDVNGVCLHSLEQAPIAINMVDTVGAGDAFAAVFIFGWQSNWPIEKTLNSAHRFATAICGVRGAVAESMVFYEDWLKEFEQFPQ